jgi:glycosyltransferase 2 family protein
VMWVSFGVHIWLLARGLHAEHDHLFLLSTGAYALAWIVGFLVVVAPAGVGVREGVLLLVLGPVLGRPETLALALVSRMLMLAGDLLTSAVAVLVARRDPRTDLASEAGAYLPDTDVPISDVPRKGGHA